MGDWAADLLNMGCEVWNTLVGYSIEFMSKTPDTYNAGVWSTIVLLNNTLFIPVASALITLFFMIGFCQETQDIHTDIRFETVFKYLIRLAVTEALVTYNLNIIQAIFKVFGNLYDAITVKAGGINGNTIFDQSSIVAYLRNLDTIPAIGYILLNLIFLMVMAVLAITMFYTIFTRLLKILVMIPLGAFAMSTVAGGRSIAMSAQSFIKYIISVAGEIIIIILALIVMKSLGNDGLGLKTVLGISKDLNVSNIFFTELEAIITTLITVGLIKSAQSMLQKALSL